MGGDVCHISLSLCQVYFNPRLRMGGDLISNKGIVSLSLFQSTPPYGRRLVKDIDNEILRQDFNPRLRMGGDSSIVRAISWQSIISIHASVWEATTTTSFILQHKSSISIHASVWEATDNKELISKLNNIISIHASVWEATKKSNQNIIINTKFQSTPPYGRRLAWKYI